MSGDLVLVHTVAGLTDLFDGLRAELDPDVPVRHVVQADAAHGCHRRG